MAGCRKIVGFCGVLPVYGAGDGRSKTAWVGYPRLIGLFAGQEAGEAAGDLDEFGGHHEDGGAVVFGADFGDHLHAAELEGGGVADHEVGGLGEFLGGFELSFGLDDAGALFADGFGFHGHDPLQVLGDLDILHFEQLDGDAPGRSGVIDGLAEELVDFVALFEDLVEVVLADDVAQGGERELLDGAAIVFDREDGFFGVFDAIPENGVDLYGDAVPGDGFLLLDGVGDDAEIDADLVFRAQGKKEEEPRSAQAGEAAEAEDDRALVLPRHSHAGADDEEQEDDGDGEELKMHAASILPEAAAQCGPREPRAAISYHADDPAHAMKKALGQLGAMPNLLTMLRLFIVPFLVIEILDHHWKLAFALLWVAGVSDGLDGLLARVLQQRTTLGQFLDPIADKLLLSTMFLVLTHVGVIPRYVTVLVFSRDLGILLISTLLFVTHTLRDFRPSLLGKLNTTVQILAVLTVMTAQVLTGARLQEATLWLLRAVAWLAPLSAAQYAWITLRRVQQEPAGA